MSAPSEPSSPGDTELPVDRLGYLRAVAELDAILVELEAEAVDVDRLAERVQRAAALIRYCRQRIGSARVEIEAITADLDRLDDTPPG